jgi:hypothetical protein
MKEPLHPAAAWALRGIGRVFQKAASRAAESFLEDVQEAFEGMASRAKSARARVLCTCTCRECIKARRTRTVEDHCEKCEARR